MAYLYIKDNQAPMGKRDWKRKKKANSAIASERVSLLMSQARVEALSGCPNKADEYAALARRISMRYKTPIPLEHKRSICKNCGAFLYPGISCHVRLKRGRKIYHCVRCQSLKRVPYKK
jgi:ribonuclease P protein subunit RPR2